MVYLYDDETNKRVELTEIKGIDKDCNVLIAIVDAHASVETLVKAEKIIEEKTGKKCVVLPKGFTILGIK